MSFENATRKVNLVLRVRKMVPQKQEAIHVFNCQVYRQLRLLKAITDFADQFQHCVTNLFCSKNNSINYRQKCRKIIHLLEELARQKSHLRELEYAVRPFGSLNSGVVELESFGEVLGS